MEDNNSDPGQHKPAVLREVWHFIK